jgi:hypothetical protein
MVHHNSLQSDGGGGLPDRCCLASVEWLRGSPSPPFLALTGRALSEGRAGENSPTF